MPQPGGRPALLGYGGRHSPAHLSGQHNIQPAGGAELPAAGLGRPVQVEREPGEPLEQSSIAILISAREKACPAQKCRPVPNAMFTWRGRKMSGRPGSVNFVPSLFADETKEPTAAPRRPPGRRLTLRQ
jgi:hypothetical protein